jgi:hypothetical protein
MKSVNRILLINNYTVRDIIFTEILVSLRRYNLDHGQYSFKLSIIATYCLGPKLWSYER